MFKQATFLVTFLFFNVLTFAQGPTITSWVINTTGATGYNNIPSNVQAVKYTTTDVYVSATCIPGYDIGPWAANPNTPTNQNFVFKLTRNPTQNTGTATNVGLGQVGVWSNGVVVFNAKDGMTYNNAGVWNRNAYYWEGASFDDCLGHPGPSGAYHHHVNPDCLYDKTANTVHSPIIGYAFDGYPIYGAYAYTNTNGTGAIKRMVSSYVLSTATTRTNGPAVSATYPAGCFTEDYLYTAGSGDLDSRNGRFCITPEYPSGTYAYFVTIDANLNPVYPFVLGSTYYGIVQTGNTGPNSGHNTIPANAVTYTPNSGTPLATTATSTNVSCFGSANGTITVTTSGGTSPYIYAWNGGATTQNRTGLAAGTYTVTITDATAQTATATATITQPTVLTATATATNVTCSTAASITLAVSGGTSPYSYNWGGGITTQNRTGLAAGTYTVTITDANTCSTTASKTITNTTLSVPTGLSTTNITATSAKFNWSAVSGAANYTIQGHKVGTGTWVTIGPVSNTFKTVNSQITACKTYEWKVNANCTTATLSSAYSSPITFTTPCAAKTDDLDATTTSFGLLPNPASSTVTISYDSETEKGISIQFFDVTGKTISAQTNTLTEGNNTITVDVSKLSQGFYMVVLTDGANQLRKKLLIVK